MQPFAIELDDVQSPLRPDERPALDGFSLRLEPGRRVVPASAGAEPARRPSCGCSCGSSTRSADASPLAGEDLRWLPPGGRARPCRRRGPGRAPVLGEHPRQRQARPARCERRRPRASPALCPHPRLGAEPPGRPRHTRRRGEAEAVGRRARAGSCSRARSSPRRPCSCSTSRPRTSIHRRRRPSSGTCSPPRAAARSCLITHRPEGVDLADEVVVLREPRVT